MDSLQQSNSRSIESSKISVLITYFNERELLRNTLLSLQRQTIPVDEIIIYDDASEYPAADYVPANIRVNVIRGENNIGLSQSRNFLLKSAGCEYVHFHDADDLFSPRWSEQVKRKLENHPGLVITMLGTVSPDQTRTYTHDLLGLHRLKNETLLELALEGVIFVTCITVLKQRALDIGGFRGDASFAEDVDFSIRYLLGLESSYAVIPEVLVFQNLRNDSMSRTLEGAMKKERLLGVVDVFRQIYRDIPSRYYPLVADRVTQCAFALVRIWQDFDAGKQTLKFAYHLTSPSRRGVPPRYQSLARLVGVRGAFIIAFVYGKISSALKTNRRSSSSAQ